MINPPTMPIAGPIGLVNRSPASLKTSMDISINNASISAGNGTPDFVPIMEMAN